MCSLPGLKNTVVYGVWDCHCIASTVIGPRSFVLSLRTWTLEQDMLTTMTPGSSYKANGRVEGEMNVIKKSIRTLISANV